MHGGSRQRGRASDRRGCSPVRRGGLRALLHVVACGCSAQRKSVIAARRTAPPPPRRVNCWLSDTSSRAASQSTGAFSAGRTGLGARPRHRLSGRPSALGAKGPFSGCGTAPGGAVLHGDGVRGQGSYRDPLRSRRLSPLSSRRVGRHRMPEAASRRVARLALQALRRSAQHQDPVMASDSAGTAGWGDAIRWKCHCSSRVATGDLWRRSR